MKKAVVNILCYQMIWFLGVLGGNVSALLGIPVLLGHLYFSQKKVSDLLMMGCLLLVGLLVDGALVQIGFFSFTSAGFPIPFWLMMIWLGLAILPGHSLAWLQDRLLLSSCLGALGGPIAYWAGVRLGAAAFNWPLLSSLVTLAVLWGCLVPIIMRLAVLSEKQLLISSSPKKTGV